MSDYDRHWRLFFFLDNIVEHREAYNRIKSNEEERKTSKHLGKLAVKYNITYFILTAIFTLCAILTYVFFGGIVPGMWKGIITVLFAIVTLPYLIIYFLLALNCDIKQMKLNKLPIGWVSLLFTLLILIGSIVAIVVTVLVVGGI